MRVVLSSLVLSFAAGVLAACVPTETTNSFRAVNGLRVVAEAPDRFHVPWFGLPGDTAFWCAAGDYVQRRLGMSGSTRIYRVSEPPRRSGEGITFSLSPDGAASRTGVTQFFGAGHENSLSVASATSFCDPFFWR